MGFELWVLLEWKIYAYTALSLVWIYISLVQYVWAFEKYILDNDFEKIHSKIEKNNTELKSFKKELIRKKDNFEKNIKLGK